MESLPAEPPGKPQNTGVGSLSLSSGSSRPRNQTRVSCISGRFFTSWATREAQFVWETCQILVIKTQRDLSSSFPWSKKWNSYLFTEEQFVYQHDKTANTLNSKFQMKFFFLWEARYSGSSWICGLSCWWLENLVSSAELPGALFCSEEESHHFSKIDI